MKIVHASLQLSTSQSDRTRERCPDVVFFTDAEQVGSIRTDVEQPELPFPVGSVDELMIHDDALSRVIDEETWLAELGRVMAPGGILYLTLPAEGILAWLDTMNVYRYVADLSNRGYAPNAALPTGWNRHYTREHIRHLMSDAGFAEPVISAQNYAWQEIRMLTGMLRNNWINREQDAEQRLFPRFGRRDPQGRSMRPATTWSITAQKR